jgi:hypothetical protein
MSITPASASTPGRLRSQRFSEGALRSQLACRTTLRSQAHPCCRRSA